MIRVSAVHNAAEGWNARTTSSARVTSATIWPATRAQSSIATTPGASTRSSTAERNRNAAPRRALLDEAVGGAPSAHDPPDEEPE